MQRVQLCLLSFSFTALVEALMSTAAKAVQEGMHGAQCLDTVQPARRGWLGASRGTQTVPGLWEAQERNRATPVSRELGSLKVVGTSCSGARGRGRQP